MNKLTAEFLVKLPSFVLLSGPQDKSYQSQAVIDGFDVTVELIPYQGGIMSKTKQDSYMTFGAIDIRVLVSSDNTYLTSHSSMSDAPKTQDYNFFLERTRAYQVVALKAINRTIGYFRYKLHNPLLRNIDLYSQEALHNPKWMDENGIVIDASLKTTISIAIPGIVGPKLGANPLIYGDFNEFELALQDDFIPDVYQEILADAQDAIYQDNYRRAVLEMAIAVETVIKAFYFGSEGVSSATIDYLEDKGRVNLKVLELIDSVAKQVFGVSFKDYDKESYTHIDFLFRCRNKAAHKGLLFFRDDMGEMHEVDRGMLITWWRSVSKLFEWLNSIQRNKM